MSHSLIVTGADEVDAAAVEELSFWPLANREGAAIVIETSSRMSECLTFLMHYPPNIDKRLMAENWYRQATGGFFGKDLFVTA